MSVDNFPDAVQLIINEANAWQSIVEGQATDADVVTPGGAQVSPIRKIYGNITNTANGILAPAQAAASSAQGYSNQAQLAASAAANSSGVTVRQQTLSALNANKNYPANTLALVLDDAANSGTYYKVGAYATAASAVAGNASTIPFNNDPTQFTASGSLTIGTQTVAYTSITANGTTGGTFNGCTGNGNGIASGAAITQGTQSWTLQASTTLSAAVNTGMIKAGPALSGFSGTLSAPGEFANMTASASAQPTMVWTLPLTIPTGGVVTFEYDLTKTGVDTPRVYLGDGSGNVMSNQVNLTADGTMRSAVLTATGNAVKLFIIANTTAVLTVSGNVNAWLGSDVDTSGPQTNAQNTSIFAMWRMLKAGVNGALTTAATATAAVSTRTEELGIINGAPVFNNFTASSAGPSAGQISTSSTYSGVTVNGYVYWTIHNGMANGEILTLDYCMTKTGSNVVAYLTDGSSVQQSATATLTCDGVPRRVKITSTGSNGAATRLLIQQQATQTSTLTGNVAAFRGDGTATAQQTNPLLTSLHAMLQFYSSLLGAMQTQQQTNTTNIAGNTAALTTLSNTVSGITATLSPRSIFPITARNGICYSTFNGAQSIRRKMLNGSTAAQKLRVRLPNWYLDGSMVEQPGANDITVAMSIEYPIGSTPRPFSLNSGATTMTVKAGSTLEAFELSGLLLPANATFYLHYFVSPVGGSGAGSIPTGRDAIAPTGWADTILTGGTATDKTQTIGGETTAIATPTNLYTQIVLAGEPVVGSAPISVIGIGDSVSRGSNESWGTPMGGDANANVGPWERWLGAAGIGFINLGRSSSKATHWTGLANGTSYNRLLASLRGLGSHAIVALGINDLSGSRTAQQLLGDLGTIADFVKNSMSLKPVGCTVPATTQSNDSWATLGGQTQTSWSTGPRVTHNTNLRASGTRPASMISVIELADAWETARNSSYWITTGSANGYTMDGTHPQPAANVIAVASFPIPGNVFQ